MLTSISSCVVNPHFGLEKTAFDEKGDIHALPTDLIIREGSPAQPKAEDNKSSLNQGLKRKSMMRLAPDTPIGIGQPHEVISDPPDVIVDSLQIDDRQTNPSFESLSCVDHIDRPSLEVVTDIDTISAYTLDSETNAATLHTHVNECAKLIFESVVHDYRDAKSIEAVMNFPDTLLGSFALRLSSGSSSHEILRLAKFIYRYRRYHHRSRKFSCT